VRALRRRQSIESSKITGLGDKLGKEAAFYKEGDLSEFSHGLLHGEA